jgi:hypothetical protein
MGINSLGKQRRCNETVAAGVATDVARNAVLHYDSEDDSEKWGDYAKDKRWLEYNNNVIIAFTIMKVTAKRTSIKIIHKTQYTSIQMIRT